MAIKKIRNKQLLLMLKELMRQESTYIPYKQIVDAFPNPGEELSMGAGKTLELIERGIDSKGFDYVLLSGFMPKGSKYTSNYHNATEVFTVVTGKIRDTTFNMNRTCMGQFFWGYETAHSLLALEDSRWMALITKTEY